MRLDPFARRAPRLALALLAGSLFTSCGDPVSPPDPNPYSGEYLLAVTTSRECLPPVLPFGFGVAPLGGGRAVLVQDGDRLTGQLYIFDVPSGHLEGTLVGNKIRFTFTLEGRNVGVLLPEHEPCRVVGTADGSISACYLGGILDGTFACPYSCISAGHNVLLSRCR